MAIICPIAYCLKHLPMVFNRRKKLDLDHVLIRFSDQSEDAWTIRNAVEGVQIFGGIGSGKSSGSGKTIAKSFLKNGFGGVVLCAKPDEKESWIKYAKETRREDDLIIFEKGGEYEFNPFEYEMTRPGEGAGEIFNLSNLFMAIYKMGNRFSGSGDSNESERYWDNALKRTMNQMLQLLKLAKEEISVANMKQLIISAPTENEVENLSQLSDDDLFSWAEENYCVECIIKASQNITTLTEEEEYSDVHNFFMNQFANLPEKTKSTIIESFLGIAEPFSRGILKDYFSKGTNLKPEVTHEGKIIILNFPVKEYLQAGVYAQGIFKLLWQQAAERRNSNEDLLPIFIWVDEAQLFLSDYDQVFQTTARSSRACTVFISQNISNYYAVLGGTNPKPKIDSLLGNLNTKIFHCNNDAVTNQWASNTIGKEFISIRSEGKQKKQFGLLDDSKSVGYSQQLLPQVIPTEFTLLRSGGKPNNYKVQAIIQVNGRKWSEGKNYKRVIFSQQ